MRVVVVLGPLLEKRRSDKRAAAVPISTLREPPIAPTSRCARRTLLARRLSEKLEGVNSGRSPHYPWLLM